MGNWLTNPTPHTPSPQPQPNHHNTLSQPSISNQPTHNQPPPSQQAVGPTIHLSPQPPITNEPHTQPPHCESHSDSSSASQESVPPAKRPRLEPNVGQASIINQQYPHITEDACTSHRTASVTQHVAPCNHPQTYYVSSVRTQPIPTPTSSISLLQSPLQSSTSDHSATTTVVPESEAYYPLVTGGRSITQRPTPSHTTSTPLPLQSRVQFQSSSSVHPHTTGAVSESLLHPPLLTGSSSVRRQPRPTGTPPLESPQQSQSSSLDHAQMSTVISEHQCRRVEDIFNKYTSDLTRVIGHNLTYFANKFIEVGFVSRDSSDNILSQRGTGNGEKGSQLLSLVIDNCNTAHDKKYWLDKFVGIFSSEAAYVDLATSMAEEFRYSVANLPPSHAGYASLDHLPPLVRSFIDYVKTFYTSKNVERDTSVVKWPPTPSKVFINLACINRQSVSASSREYKEVTKAMVNDGNVDVILDVTKGPIDFSEIAENISITDINERRLILVEGAPGVGKSTFAWEFCRRWERGEIVQQYHLVLLLRLREERISNAKTLKDLICHPLEDILEAVCYELVKSRLFHPLIILEGFDELPEICRQDSSVFMHLVSGQLLPTATVLVTSRPWATRKILLKCRNRIYQHIEILGFTSCQITEYIESTLPHDKVSDLSTYLESHPQIRAGMYIPLNCAIVVTVYEESQVSGYPLPTTLTELYTSVVRTLLVRYLYGHPEYQNVDKYLDVYEDLVPSLHCSFHKLCNLPLPVHEKLCKLCSIAYDATVVSAFDVQLIFKNLPSHFDDLGFMDSVTELYVTEGAVSSYNFLHLTFQEFFAAVHLSSLSPAQQVEHFQKHWRGRLKVALRFLAGLNKMNCFENSMHETCSSFFQTSKESLHTRYQLCCEAAVTINLLEWLFEAQNSNVIELVLGQRKIEFSGTSMLQTLCPMDYYSLGYCISCSQCQWILTLRGEEIDDDVVKMFINGANTKSDPSGRVVGLKVVMGNDCHSITNHLNLLFIGGRNVFRLHQLSLRLPDHCDLITWPDLSALRVLELNISGQKDYKLNTVLPCLSLESLTILSASKRSVLVYNDSVAIANHVKSTTSLKELCFKYIHGLTILDEKGLEAITEALASNDSLPLERLELECECTISATAGDSLAQYIKTTTTLQYLSIDYCTFAHALLALIRAIHYNSILQSKYLWNFKLVVNGDNEAKDVAQLLVEYPNLTFDNSGSQGNERAASQAQPIPISALTRLDLSNSNISDIGVEALAQALNVKSTLLAWLHLSNNNISDVGAVALAQALHQNSSLKWLYLSNNSINDTGAEALAKALYQNSTLEWINLSNNSISKIGAVALAQALHVNSTMKGLNLSCNNISDAGADALALALRHNSTLTWLYLSHCGISNTEEVINPQESIGTGLSVTNDSNSDAGAVALAVTLHHNTTLRLLDLSNNGIKDSEAVALAQALHHNFTLIWLDLCGNEGISANGTHHLVQALTVNDVIKSYNGLRLPRVFEEAGTNTLPTLS